MTTLTLKCHQCTAAFEKETKEYNRRVRQGHSVFFCSISCGVLHSSAQPSRRKLNQKLGAMNVCLMQAPKVQAKAAYAKESWKYVEVESLLRERKVAHKFEFPLVTKRGSVRLYDLALRDGKLLVEFDGDYHHRNGKAYNKRDAAKEKLAAAKGWQLVRIPVKANAVIPEKAIRHLLLQSGLY